MPGLPAWLYPLLTMLPWANLPTSLSFKSLIHCSANNDHLHFSGYREEDVRLGMEST